MNGASGELSINKASALVKDPAKQLEAFRLHKSGKAINRVIRVLPVQPPPGCAGRRRVELAMARKGSVRHGRV
jgi:hypothetical protein